MCYDYLCKKCDTIIELSHSMSNTSPKLCNKCGTEMTKQISCGYIASKGFNPTLADHRETEHTTKVKDLERAVRMRKRAFGHDAVGDPVDKPDPKHIVKRGKVLQGEEKTIDKDAFVKAMSRDNQTVEKCRQILENQKK
jgi:putative FmdB family regulatory protein